MRKHCACTHPDSPDHAKPYVAGVRAFLPSAPTVGADGVSTDGVFGPSTPRTALSVLEIRERGSTRDGGAYGGRRNSSRGGAGESKDGAEGGGEGKAEEPQVMSVAIPQGVKEGGVFRVNVPWRGVMMLAAPVGLRPGQSFRFQLPPKHGAVCVCAACRAQHPERMLQLKNTAAGSGAAAAGGGNSGGAAAVVAPLPHRHYRHVLQVGEANI